MFNFNMYGLTWDIAILMLRSYQNDVSGSFNLCHELEYIEIILRLKKSSDTFLWVVFHVRLVSALPGLTRLN